MTPLFGCVLGLLILFGSGPSGAAEELLQAKPGFVGYVPAGLVVVIKQVDLDSQMLTIVAEKDAEAGKLKVSFKNFERALGGKNKVEYLNKVEPVVGRSFALKHNLILAPIKKK